MPRVIGWNAPVKAGREWHQGKLSRHMSRVIQSLWVGGRLSTMEQLCIRSFQAHGHEFVLYVYEATDGVPPGTVVMDANDIIPASRIFTYREHSTYAGFANFFRYKLLLEKGGWVYAAMSWRNPSVVNFIDAVEIEVCVNKEAVRRTVDA